jgi:hypothetical protein
LLSENFPPYKSPLGTSDTGSPELLNHFKTPLLPTLRGILSGSTTIPASDYTASSGGALKTQGQRWCYEKEEERSQASGWY